MFIQAAEHAHPDFIVVATKEPGTVFGELALKYDIGRTATCVCKTDYCRLGSLSREIFREIIDSNIEGGVIENELKEKLDFLKKLLLFEGLPFDSFSGIGYSMKLVSFS